MKTALVLPAYAHEFLATHDARHAEKVMRVLRRWLDRRGFELGTRTTKDVHAFLAAPADRAVSALTRNDYRYKLRRYIDWLHGQQRIGFDAAWLRVRHKVLDDIAENSAIC